MIAAPASRAFDTRARPWRTSVVEALVLFGASRLLVLLVLLPSDRAPHSYLWDWDTGFYRTVAENGYHAIGVPAIDHRTPAFFPLLPMLEWLGSRLGGSVPAWGAVIGTVCSAAALILLHRQMSGRFGERPARLAVAAVAFFPFSFVLSTGYTEGPYLLLSIGAYWLVQDRRGPAAGLTAFLAGLSRPTAVFLAAGLAWDAWHDRPRRTAALAAVAGVAAAVAAYALYLRHVRGDALAAVHAQQVGWGRSVSPQNVPGELWKYVDQAVTWPRLTYLAYLTGVPLAIAGLVVLWRRGIRDGAFVYALIGLLAPLGTGSAMSLPRFLMATFPYAWAAGLGLDRLPRRWAVALLVLSAAGLVACLWGSYWESGKLPP
jgi:hypothetical protein